MSIGLINDSELDENMNFARIIFSRDTFSGKLTEKSQKEIVELYSFLKNLGYPINLSLDEEGKKDFIVEKIDEIVERLSNANPKIFEKNKKIEIFFIIEKYLRDKKEYIKNQDKEYEIFEFTQDTPKEIADILLVEEEEQKEEQKGIKIIRKTKEEKKEEKTIFVQLKSYIDQKKYNIGKSFLDNYIESIEQDGIGSIRNPKNSTLKPYFNSQSYVLELYEDFIKKYLERYYKNKKLNTNQENNLEIADLGEHVFYYILENFFPENEYKILKTHEYDDKISKADFIIENKKTGKKISLDLTTNSNFIYAKNANEESLLKKENVVHRVYNIYKKTGLSEKQIKDFLSKKPQEIVKENKIKDLVKMDNYVFPVEKTLMELFIKNFLEGFEKGIIDPRKTLVNTFFEKTFKEYASLNINFYGEYEGKNNNDNLYFFIEQMEKYKEKLN